MTLIRYLVSFGVYAVAYRWMKSYGIETPSIFGITLLLFVSSYITLRR